MRLLRLHSSVFFKQFLPDKKSLCNILSLIFLLCFASHSWADVTINASNFPDNTFRAFVASSVDLNTDGILSTQEISKLQVINASRARVASYKGIEYFTSLQRFNCYSNDITELDLSKNLNLIEINCAHNKKLTTLKIGRNTNLTSLSCYACKLSELDLSGCTSLKTLSAFTNELSTLKLDGCNNLQDIDLPNNQLTALDIRNFTNLTTLDVRNNKITNLDASNKTALKTLNCGDNELVSLNVTNCTALVRFNCYMNKLTALDVSTCRALQYLFCYNNRLTELNITNNSNLIELDCSRNYISVLNTSGLTNLTRLSFANNMISDINVRNSTKLRSLSLWCNQLTELDVTQNRELALLQFSYNQIKTLNLSNNTKLEILTCERNQFAALDLGSVSSLVSKGSDGWNVSEFEQQIVNPLNITEQTGNDYPYVLSFSNYMTSSQFANIEADSVQGYDSDNNEIETSYSSGTASFAANPAKVRYKYKTGLDNRSLNVTISNSGEDYMTLSLNNHVYRIIFSPMDWDKANEYCEKIGGHLLTVTNEAEMQLIIDMMTEASRLNGEGVQNSHYWIGGFTGEKADDVPNSYNWPDNENVSADSKLQIGFDIEYGLYVYQEAKNNYLNFYCDFICEWDPVAGNFSPYADDYKRYLENPGAYIISGDPLGEIPEAVDYSHLADDPAEVSFDMAPPSKYDPRDLGLLPPVRNQGSYGTCWSFASLGALETSYIVQGFGSTAPDLSELHQAWFVFKDPRPSYARPLHDKSEHVLNQGGNNSMSIAFLSRIGTASENELPYTQASNVSRLTAGKYPENYSQPIKLKEAYELGAITEKNRDEVKQLIMKYGAVRIGYYHSSSGIQNNSYYFTGSAGGHAVNIVGWDDNYSLSNFKTKPKANGAWLVKNSWGTDWADNGFIWMSYEQNIYTSAVYIAAENDIKNFYGHDAVAAIDSIPHNWSAVMFKADNDEILNEAAFYTRSNNTQYEIYIKNYGTKEPANPGVPQGNAAASGKIAYAGYHTVKLSTPFSVKKGEYFSVMVKLTASYGYPTAVENTGDIVNAASTVTIAGKSYFARTKVSPVSADWRDGKRLTGAAQSKSCGATIKIFAVSGGPAQIVTSNLPAGIVGQRYSHTLTAGGLTPITWTVTGLPDGLTHNNGVISGTPKSQGTSTITITAENEKGSDTKKLELVIKPKSDNPDPDNPSPNSDEGGSSGGGGGGCDMSFGVFSLAILGTVLIMRRK